MSVATTSIDYKKYFQEGISYQEYLSNFSAEMESGIETKFTKYLPQNWQRHSRLDSRVKLTDELKQAIAEIVEPQNWLLISEHWCGDASQINPIANKIAETSNGKISLRVVYRDKNLPLIDAHLTDGRSRSIPMIIKLDSDYNERGSYGPRPAEAQVLVKEYLAKGESYMTPLHTWYAKDKTKSTQRDLIQLIVDNGCSIA